MVGRKHYFGRIKSAAACVFELHLLQLAETRIHHQRKIHRAAVFRFARLQSSIQLTVFVNFEDLSCVRSAAGRLILASSTLVMTFTRLTSTVIVPRGVAA